MGDRLNQEIIANTSETLNAGKGNLTGVSRSTDEGGRTDVSIDIEFRRDREPEGKATHHLSPSEFDEVLKRVKPEIKGKLQALDALNPMPEEPSRGTPVTQTPNVSVNPENIEAQTFNRQLADKVAGTLNRQANKQHADFQTSFSPAEVVRDTNNRQAFHIKMHPEAKMTHSEPNSTDWQAANMEIVDYARQMKKLPTDGLMPKESVPSTLPPSQSTPSSGQAAVRQSAPIRP